MHQRRRSRLRSDIRPYRGPPPGPKLETGRVKESDGQSGTCRPGPQRRTTGSGERPRRPRGGDVPAGGAPRRGDRAGPSPAPSGCGEPDALPGAAPVRRAVVATRARRTRPFVTGPLRAARPRDHRECALRSGPRLPAPIRPARPQLHGRPCRARPQHRRPVRLPAAREGAARHGDAPERGRTRLRAGPPSGLLGNGRGEDQRRARLPRGVGADGPERPQGLRRGCPPVPDLR